MERSQAQAITAAILTHYMDGNIRQIFDVADKGVSIETSNGAYVYLEPKEDDIFRNAAILAVEIESHINSRDLTLSADVGIDRVYYWLDVVQSNFANLPQELKDDFEFSKGMWQFLELLIPML